MYASVIYKDEVEIHINDDGASVMLATCNDIKKAMIIVDLLNATCCFSRVAHTALSTK